MSLLNSLLGRIVYALREFWPYVVFFIGTSFIILVCLIMVIRRPFSQRFKRVIVAGSASLLSLLIAFTLAEAYFRFVYDASDSLGFLSIADKWQARHVSLNGSYVRDREFDPQKRPDEIRVAVIGDSIAFGWGIKNQNNRFSNRLEKLLINSGKDATVYNLGRYGFGTSDEIKTFHDHAFLDFDIVVWQYFPNDMFSATDNLNPTIVGQAKERLKPQGILAWVTKVSVLAEFVYWHLSVGYDETFKQLNYAYLSGYEDPTLLSRHQQQIAAFLTELKSKNIPVVVIIFPFLGDQLLQERSIPYELQIVKFFEQSGANSVIRLSDALTGIPNNQLVVGRFDNHPNEKVHELTAEKIYHEINKIDLTSN